MRDAASTGISAPTGVLAPTGAPWHAGGMVLRRTPHPRCPPHAGVANHQSALRHRHVGTLRSNTEALSVGRYRPSLPPLRSNISEHAMATAMSSALPPELRLSPKRRGWCSPDGGHRAWAHNQLQIRLAGLQRQWRQSHHKPRDRNRRSDRVSEARAPHYR